MESTNDLFSIGLINNQPIENLSNNKKEKHNEEEFQQKLNRLKYKTQFEYFMKLFYDYEPEARDYIIPYSNNNIINKKPRKDKISKNKLLNKFINLSKLYEQLSCDDLTFDKVLESIYYEYKWPRLLNFIISILTQLNSIKDDSKIEISIREISPQMNGYDGYSNFTVTCREPLFTFIALMKKYYNFILIRKDYIYNTRKMDVYEGLIRYNEYIKYKYIYSVSKI